MALTPEDVVNKRFQPTKFREGYDQDEVDDFLDEVVNELRRLSGQNQELREKLGACERRVGELTRGGATAAAAGVPADDGQEASEPEEPAPLAARVPDEPADDRPVDDRPVPSGNGPEAVAGMLQLAQKLHDDYVRSGEEQRDKIVGEAKEHASRLVQEAEERQRETLDSLEREQSLLERKIDELRAFERDYRARLRSYLEGQLRELETRGVGVPTPEGETA